MLEERTKWTSSPQRGAFLSPSGYCRLLDMLMLSTSVVQTHIDRRWEQTMNLLKVPFPLKSGPQVISKRIRKMSDTETHTNTFGVTHFKTTFRTLERFYEWGLNRWDDRSLLLNKLLDEFNFPSATFTWNFNTDSDCKKYCQYSMLPLSLYLFHVMPLIVTQYHLALDFS